MTQPTDLVLGPTTEITQRPAEELGADRYSCRVRGPDGSANFAALPADFGDLTRERFSEIRDEIRAGTYTRGSALIDTDVGNGYTDDLGGVVVCGDLDDFDTTVRVGLSLSRMAGTGRDYEQDLTRLTVLLAEQVCPLMLTVP